jgi:hypothetical protein
MSKIIKLAIRAEGTRMRRTYIHCAFLCESEWVVITPGKEVREQGEKGSKRETESGREGRRRSENENRGEETTNNKQDRPGGVSRRVRYSLLQ